MLVIYTLLAATALVLIILYPRNDLHLMFNSYVGNRYVNAFFYYITYLGDGRIAPLILLAILLANVRLGLSATVSFLTAALIANALKYFFFDHLDRPSFIFQFFDGRPVNWVEGVDLHIHNSFPSGHATQGFAILMNLAYAAVRPWIKFVLLALAVFTSFSRVYLSQHWLQDVTAGSFIGLCVSWFTFYLIVYRQRWPALNKPVTFPGRR